MPVTQIFSGVFYRRISGGSVDLRGNGDTADIILKDSANKTTTATIKVYVLSELQELALFQNAVDADSELLVSLWRTKKTENTIIKYAPEHELAFAFTSGSEVEKDFLMITESGTPHALTYFQEVASLNRLKKANISIEQLKQTSGMDDQKIKLIITHLSQFIELMKLEFTLSHVASMNYEMLQNCLKDQYDLKIALKYVTVEQILGLSHTPRSLYKEKKDVGTIICQGGSGEYGEFRFVETDNELVITHSNNAKLTLRWNLATEDAVTKINTQLSSLALEELIHPWYSSIRNNGLWILRYCPTAKWIISESYDSAFPLDQFKESVATTLLQSPYHLEKRFADFLAENGTSISELKALQGMTEGKINVFKEHSIVVPQLLQKGMTFEQLAQVDTERLEQVLFNYRSEAYRALRFVAIEELLGLGKTALKHSPVFFSPPVIHEEDLPVRRSWLSCPLL